VAVKSAEAVPIRIDTVSPQGLLNAVSTWLISVDGASNDRNYGQWSFGMPDFQAAIDALFAHFSNLD
jgi:hypothetical protein